MQKSMTGFGFSKIKYGDKAVLVEIKSLNSKFLDLSIRSMTLAPLQDIWIRNECSNGLVRGKITLSVTLEEGEKENRNGKAMNLNVSLIRQYLETLIPIAQQLSQKTDSLLSNILLLPGIVQTSEETLEEDIWVQIQKGVLDGLKMLNEFREREGEIIQRELETRVNHILEELKKIEEWGPGRLNVNKSRIINSLKDLKSNLEWDQNRFEQELIYYIDKMDFSEEISRLYTHSMYFLECLKDQEFGGKKLGFIAQEMGREINTLGSKASDALIQKMVVQMKEELEKIKEQLANIL